MVLSCRVTFEIGSGPQKTMPLVAINIIKMIVLILLLRRHIFLIDSGKHWRTKVFWISCYMTYCYYYWLGPWGENASGNCSSCRFLASVERWYTEGRKLWAKTTAEAAIAKWYRAEMFRTLLCNSVILPSVFAQEWNRVRLARSPWICPLT